jgi:hypothetical protein
MRYLKTMMTKLLLLGSLWIQAQAPRIPADFNTVYPEYPIDVWAAAKAEYTRITQYKEVYHKDEMDESGLVWSIPVENYQSAVWILAGKNVETFTAYTPENQRLRRSDYYYKDGKLSAIDEMRFDTAQKDKLLYTDIYVYEHDGRPFQRVRQYAKDKHLREICSFRFDTQNRLVKSRVEYTGTASKTQTLALIGTGKQSINWEYGGQSIRRGVYHNYNELIESQDYTFENNQLKQVRTYTEHLSLKNTIEYEYQDGRLYKSIDTPAPAPDAEAPKSTVSYYFYTEDGFLERHLIEHENTQTVYVYSYSKN